MIYLLFSFGIFATILCWRKKYELNAAQKKNSAWYVFLENFLFFLVPFTGVTGFYAILSIYTSFINQNSTTLETLYQFQESLRSLRELVGSARLTTWQSFGVLAFLFALAAIGVVVRRQPDSSRSTSFGKSVARGSAIFARYSKIMYLSYLTCTLLCSFTFFAYNIDASLGKLEGRIKEAEEKTKKLGAGIVKAFEDEVWNTLIKEVIEKTHPEVKTVQQKTFELHQQENELWKEYQNAKSRYGLESSPIERFWEQLPTKQQSFKNAIERAETAQTGRRWFNESANLSADRRAITIEKLDIAERELARHEQESQARPSEILKLDEAKRLSEKGIESLLASGRETVMPFLEEYPFVEPIIKVFEKSLSKIAEANILRPYLQRLAEKAIHGKPNELKAAIRSETLELVKQESGVEEIWNEHVRENAGKLQQQSQELAHRTNAVQNINQELEVETGVKRAELLAEKQKLLSDIRARFERLAEKFPSDILEFGSYNQKEVENYLKQVVERYGKAEVNLNQIEKLKMLTQQVTSPEIEKPEMQFERIQALTAQELGLARVEENSVRFGRLPEIFKPGPRTGPLSEFGPGSKPGQRPIYRPPPPRPRPPVRPPARR